MSIDFAEVEYSIIIEVRLQNAILKNNTYFFLGKELMTEYSFYTD